MIDFSNAFLQVPLHPEERKHFCIKLRGRWFLFKVMAQGASASLLSWGRVAALVSRLTQSMFHPSELLLQTFVDDPIGSVTGSERQRNYIVAAIVLVWMALGFPLAFKKGQRGPEIVWIGATLRVTSSGVEASIRKSILDELRVQVSDILKSNVVSRKVLRSFAGRCNHVATLLWPWRPFLQSLWAPLTAPSSGAPHNCVWVRQIPVSVHWIRAFLEGSSGSLHRNFCLDTYMGAGMFVELTLDASPWGLGGILQENGQIVSWFASDFTDFDFQFFKFQKGEAAGQQCWRRWRLWWHSEYGRRGGAISALG